MKNIEESRRCYTTLIHHQALPQPVRLLCRALHEELESMYQQNQALLAQKASLESQIMSLAQEPDQDMRFWNDVERWVDEPFTQPLLTAYW